MTDHREQRFDQLWQDHAPAVVRYARRHVLPDDVEDVVAETFVVAWRRLEEVPPFGLPWLLGVARNVSANVRRGHRRRDALRERVSTDTTVATAEDGAWPATDDNDPVTAALHRLSDADRELLTLIGWDGLSHEEAAEALDCSRGALKVRLHRARHRFAALLDETAGPPTAASLTICRPDQSGGAA